MGDFDTFFHKAVGKDAYAYQKEMAMLTEPPTILKVPTGCGKTAAAVLTWLWRRQQEATRDGTPRRLVYCLPMRTLVDQVRENVDKWLDRLDLRDKVAVAVLMGGDADRDWARKPETGRHTDRDSGHAVVQGPKPRIWTVSDRMAD